MPETAGANVNLLRTLVCTINRNCPMAKSSYETIEETKRLMESVETAWEPIKSTMEQEAKYRPSIADKLREAHEIVNDW